MADGLSSGLANNLLNTLRGSAYSVSGVYVKLHTGLPGSAGTSNASAVTTRSIATFAAASGGAIALTGTNPSWSMTTSETVTDISVWDSSTAGNFLWSATLTTPKTVANGDTLTLNTCGLSLTPIAS